MKKDKSVLAWHFVNKTLRDGRPVPADGVLLKHEGDIEMCRSGLHASIMLLHAAEHAPGNTLCRVKCSEIEEKERDKFVCRERTILWRVSFGPAFREVGRLLALSVTNEWYPPNSVVKYLTTGNESCRDSARKALRKIRAAGGCERSDGYYAAKYAIERNGDSFYSFQSMLGDISESEEKINTLLVSLAEAEHQKNLWSCKLKEGK